MQFLTRIPISQMEKLRPREKYFLIYQGLVPWRIGLKFKVTLILKKWIKSSDILQRNSKVSGLIYYSDQPAMYIISAHLGIPTKNEPVLQYCFRNSHHNSGLGEGARSLPNHT